MDKSASVDYHQVFENKVPHPISFWERIVRVESDHLIDTVSCYQVNEVWGKQLEKLKVVGLRMNQVFIGSKIQEKIDQALQIVFKEKKPHRIELSDDVKENWQQFKATLIPLDEDRFMMVLHDIQTMTKQGNTEFSFTLAQQIQTMTKQVHHEFSFLSNMSHEIRTPLNGIIGIVYTNHTSHARCRIQNSNAIGSNGIDQGFACPKVSTKSGITTGNKSL